MEPQGCENGMESQASPTDQECVEAYRKFGTVAPAAEHLEMPWWTLQRRLQKQAKKRGGHDIRTLLDGGFDDREERLTEQALVQLAKDQGYRCKFSGIELTPEINRMKGQLSVEEFVSLCSKVVQWMR